VVFFLNKDIVVFFLQCRRYSSIDSFKGMSINPIEKLKNKNLLKFLL